MTLNHTNTHHLGLILQEDDGLLPHNAALPVLHVVHLVKDDPGNLRGVNWFGRDNSYEKFL